MSNRVYLICYNEVDNTELEEDDQDLYKLESFSPEEHYIYWSEDPKVCHELVFVIGLNDIY